MEKSMKIGIAYTTHNRNEIALASIQKLLKLMNREYCLVVVDDASEIPYEFATFRFDKNVGVATAKNKCIELLYDWGATDFFLFDDDCFPVNELWYVPYVFSKLKHACWTFNRPLVKVHSDFIEYETPNGCMLYCTREVIDTVGGFDTSFKGYGYEHVNWSDRIFNAGLTPARYIDEIGARWCFEMADCESSFTSTDRAQIPSNYKLYQEKFNSKDFIPFK